MIRKHKKSRGYIKIFIVCAIIGLFLSFIYINSINKEELNVILNNIKNNNSLLSITNNITDHLKILSVILIFSFVYLSIPLYIGLLISEFFKIFIRLMFLFKLYKISGLLYGFIYYLITSGIYLFMLVILYKELVIIFKKIYKNRVKKEINYQNDILDYLKSSLIIILIIFISDIIIYFYATKILKLFYFIIK